MSLFLVDEQAEPCGFLADSRDNGFQFLPGAADDVHVVHIPPVEPAAAHDGHIVVNPGGKEHADILRNLVPDINRFRHHLFAGPGFLRDVVVVPDGVKLFLDAAGKFLVAHVGNVYFKGGTRTPGETNPSFHFC